MNSATTRISGANLQFGAISPRGLILDAGDCVHAAGSPASLPTPQRSTRLRKSCKAGGFTLLELMAVMVLLTIVSTAMFTGLAVHTFDSAHRRFLDDVYGLVVQARNRAIEDQTEVVVRMTRTVFSMRVVDPITHVESEWMRFDLERLYNRALQTDVCFLGVYAGVTAPGMTSPVASTPTACMSDTQDFSFLPDGSFSSPVLTGPGQGLTLVSADRRIPARPKYALIELFPGGAMRRIDNVVVAD
jgi:prepilin-type N-terminal cleavage/methylation domain-containing protein